MQGHFHCLSITNRIQSSSTDLSQWHRAHDWLHAAHLVPLVDDKSRMNFLAHDYHISGYTQNTWDLCMVTFSSMMALMQGQLMHLHSLSITNLSQSSATDLSQWHRAHDKLLHSISISQGMTAKPTSHQGTEPTSSAANRLPSNSQGQQCGAWPRDVHNKMLSNQTGSNSEQFRL